MGVHHKIAYMACRAIGGLEMITVHRLCAEQMRIRALVFPINRGRVSARRGRCGRFQNRKAPHTAPQPVTLPIVGPAIVAVIFLLVLPGHGLVQFYRRTGLDLFPGEVDGQNFDGLMETAEGVGREEHLTSRQPGTGVGNHIPHRPVLVIKIKILHLADFAVQCPEFVSV